MLVIGKTPDGTKDTATFFIAARASGGYATWLPEEDQEFRKVLGIEEDAAVATIEVRPLRNTERSEAITKKLARFRRVGEIPSHVIQAVGREADAHHVLVGWTRIGGPDGVESAFSPKRAMELFEADSRFHDAVVEAASDDHAFRVDAAAQNAEALGNASSGSSSGSRGSKGSKTPA